MAPGTMQMSLFILAVIASILLLWKGADALVDAAARIARRFNVSELVIGLTLVAAGTSAPEFAVSINAAIAGQADISVGNIVGSNIFNLGLILGLAAMIRPMLTSRALVYRDGLFLVGVTIVVATFLTDLELSRAEGIAMVAMLLAYLGALFWKRSSGMTDAELAEAGVDSDDAEEKLDPSTKAQIFDFGIVGISLGVVVGGSQLLVYGASGIATAFGMSDWAIAVTVVAAGTSAPELVTSLTAVLKDKHGISAGGLIGSDIYNLLGVLGIASIIRPLSIDSFAKGSVYVLVGAVILVVIFMRSGWKVRRSEGALLVVIAAIRWWADLSHISLFP